MYMYTGSSLPPSKSTEQASDEMMGHKMLGAVMLPVLWGLRLTSGIDGAQLSSVGRGGGGGGRDLDEMRTAYCSGHSAGAALFDLDVSRKGYATPEGEGVEGGGGIGASDLDVRRRGYGGGLYMRHRRGKAEEDMHAVGHIQSEEGIGRNAGLCAAVERQASDQAVDLDARRRGRGAFCGLFERHTHTYTKTYGSASMRREAEEDAGAAHQIQCAEVASRNAGIRAAVETLLLQVTTSVSTLVHQCLPINMRATTAGPYDSSSDGISGGNECEQNLPRHQVHAPREGDAQSQMRRELLDSFLQELGVDVKALREDEFSGNPARKAYFSFINPRRGKSGVLSGGESLAQRARRYAAQISFLHREQSVRLAEFVRNIDRCHRDESRGTSRHSVSLVLDNLRSVYNVGSIFRTAETAACQEIITCGITPHPPHEKLRKTAFSAAETVPTRHFSSTLEAVLWLKSRNVTVLAMETTNRSKRYTDYNFSNPTALVLGNEVTGVDLQALQVCDDVVEIPTFGTKNSLNVASACAVVVFEVLRQFGALGGGGGGGEGGGGGGGGGCGAGGGGRRG